MHKLKNFNIIFIKNIYYIYNFDEERKYARE